MSVIMTLVANGDPDELERRAAANHDGMRSLAERAKAHGVIAHRFYGAEGKIMVVDEWPDADSFKRFFEEVRPEVEPMMAEIGVTSEPEITFWRKLESHDEIGWES